MSNKGISNPFALLNSDDESDNEQDNTSKKVVSKQVTQTKKVAIKTVKGGNSGGVKASEPTVEEKKENHKRSGGGAKGGKPNKGSAKREYDRRSGTGRGRENKKSGAGQHNWGKQTGDVQEVVADEIAATEIAKEEDDEGTVIPEEPEKPTLSFDDYLKLRQEKRQGTAFASKEARKVTNDISGKKTVKAEQENDIDEEDKIFLKERKAKLKTKERKTKELVQANFTVKDQNAPAPREDREYRPRRGGKAGTRGGRGNNGGRGGGKSRGTRVNISDSQAFPALGA